MSTPRSRRSVLRIGATVGLAASTGCLSPLFGGPKPGSIFVDNKHESAHTVTITVTKTDDGGSSARPYGETPDPETTPLSKQTFTKTVGGKSQVLLTTLDGIGLYYIRARLDSRKVGYWLQLFEERDRGMAGDYATVVIHENGRLGMGITGGD